jgi:uncharacterized cofD-like protein
VAQTMNLVTIGGGRGSSQVALAAQPYFDQISVIVAVTDTGRSTGIARSLGPTPAPGDLRNTLATLARDPDGLLPRLLQHRFHSTEHSAYNGMALGNLMLVALTQLLGDIGSATDALSELLDPVAHVLPTSTADAQLCAELVDGSIRRGEVAVRGLNKPPIRRLFLERPAPAYAPALEAIAHAKLVVLGPGSFYTSVQAALLSNGLIDALRITPARVVFICNTTTQPGQTDGLSVFDHVQALVTLLGEGTLDAALINRSQGIDEALLAAFAVDGLHPLFPTDEEIARIAALGVQPVVRDLAERASGKRELWNKQDTIRHDPVLLGEALRAL